MRMLFDVNLKKKKFNLQHMLEQIQYFFNPLQCILNN